MTIKGFSDYELLENGNVLNLKTQKIVHEIKRKNQNGILLKMMNDNDLWVSVSKNYIIKNSLGINIPKGFLKIPNYENYYINKYGEVISLSSMKMGKKLKIYYHKDNKRYPTVNIKGKSKMVHQLLALTFIDKDYLKKGLCVLHLDNNKNNHSLSNLKVGTYSENNKQTYADGLNKGNKKSVVPMSE